MQKYTYSANNSGGGWWLSDDDWVKLEEAGWFVYWGEPTFNDKGDIDGREYQSAKEVGDNRWLGALARSADGEFTSHEEAVRSFEEATGQNYSDLGCECCGSPHSIY